MGSPHPLLNAMRFGVAVANAVSGKSTEAGTVTPLYIRATLFERVEHSLVPNRIVLQIQSRQIRQSLTSGLTSLISLFRENQLRQVRQTR